MSSQQPPSPHFPPPGTEPVRACPVCNDAARDVLHARLTDRVSFIDGNEWTLYSCRNCGSAYLDPRFDLDHIGAAYRGDYYTHHNVASSEDEAPRTFSLKVRRALRNGYLNARYGSNLSPSSVLGACVIPLLPAAQRRIDHWVKYLKSSSRPRRLLDLGCGHGAFLSRMKSMGWDVDGLDPDPDAVAAARSNGLTVQQGMLTENTFPEAAFDAITLSHVVEHLHDPVETLRLCYRALRLGGSLWICTPNLKSQGHARFGRYWVHLDPPRHLVLFTPDSLKDALRRTGFEVRAPLQNLEQASVTFPWSAQIAKADPIVPPDDEYADVVHEAALADKQAAACPSIDEEITYIARKPRS